MNCIEWKNHPSNLYKEDFHIQCNWGWWCRFHYSEQPPLINFIWHQVLLRVWSWARFWWAIVRCYSLLHNLFWSMIVKSYCLPEMHQIRSLISALAYHACMSWNKVFMAKKTIEILRFSLCMYNYFQDYMHVEVASCHVTSQSTTKYLHSGQNLFCKTVCLISVKRFNKMPALFCSTKKSTSNKCLKWQKNHRILTRSEICFNGTLRLEWFSAFSTIFMNQVTS